MLEERPRRFFSFEAKHGSDNTKEEGRQTVESAFNDLKYLICTFEARAR